MGYRSDIVVRLSEEANEKFNEAVEKDENLQHILEQSLSGNENGVITWTDIKWYEDEPEYYPDVYAMEEFLKNLPENEYLLSGMGEDGERWNKGNYYKDVYNPVESVIRDVIRDYGEERTLEWLEKAIEDVRLEIDMKKELKM